MALYDCLGELVGCEACSDKSNTNADVSFSLQGSLCLRTLLEGFVRFELADLGPGIMITTVAITSYCLNSYPEGSGEVASHSHRHPIPKCCH